MRSNPIALEIEHYELRRGAFAGNRSKVLREAKSPRLRRIGIKRVVLSRDGESMQFLSIVDAAAALGLRSGTLYNAVSKGKPAMGWTVQYLNQSAA